MFLWLGVSVDDSKKLHEYLVDHLLHLILRCSVLAELGVVPPNLPLPLLILSSYSSYLLRQVCQLPLYLSQLLHHFIHLDYKRERVVS